MTDSTPSASIDSPDAEPQSTQSPPEKPAVTYKLLEDAYGMKKGEERTARSLYQHGVTPSLLISRGLGKRV